MAVDVAPPFQPPRQARSARTLERILDVTEELLEEKPFEAISVGEIVRRAGTSVGAFYARFRDKDGLLPALYERYDRWVGERTREASDTRFWEGQALAEIVDRLVRELIAMFAHRRFLIRAMALHARQHPEKIDAATRARRVVQTRFIRDALLSRRDEIAHADPERAVDFAIFAAASVCREVLLFSEAPHAAATGVRDDELASELARQMLGYLGRPRNESADLEVP